MYVAPLTIIYKDAEYRDGIDIDPAEVYERFSEEVRSTSLPSPAHSRRAVQADSGGRLRERHRRRHLEWPQRHLQHVRGFGPTPEGLDACYIDTKNIGIGSGFSAIRAGELIEQGLPFADVCREVENTDGAPSSSSASPRLSICRRAAGSASSQPRWVRFST